MDNFEFSSTFLLFSEIERLKFQILKSEMDKYKIHPGQIPIFFIVRKNPGISQKDLAKKVMLSTSTVAIMLRRMEKAGFVKRIQDESDRRFYHIYLTDKALKIVDKIFKRLKEFERQSFENFTNEEMEVLEKLLKKILLNLEAMKDERCC
ncbi:MarR family transcriptional regulator [Thermosipho africanus H17ap60334]|uniref:MarR family winged helix-turn-helix transcriptional regulator n=2 Tax=Thermotogae TaxID=188708 RepID=UPI00028C57A3|nr:MULTISPECIES: MarR family transcriptional regulator [Thermosipho]EKF48605.1 MarR family transcriptional regulator [Thermosipho africanus H17ap60334]MBZ4650588.1 MarR-family transcriptional regulator [Thermosipho sp. (in: thermotogales)]RDI92623.1 MarR family transcriptional regulator [Thermosipho africanus Ob7]